MQMIGILCSTGAAFFWAAAVIMFKKSGETFSPMALNLFKGVVTLVLLIPTLWIVGVPLFPVRPVNDWMLLGISGLLGITLADTFFFMALKRLGASRWAVVDCLYLPFIILISAFILNESIGLKGMIGALLVIAAIGADASSGSSPTMPARIFGRGLSLGCWLWS
jgi:drug/metabolite transporter (DMT)-like permease